MLLSTPTDAHLSRMYYELAALGADSVGEKDDWPYDPKNPEEFFCLAADMSRYDPRLVSVLVRFLFKSWRCLNPTLVRQNYSLMKTPQTTAVLAEFLKNKKNTDRELFYFIRYLQSGLSPVSSKRLAKRIWRRTFMMC